MELNASSVENVEPTYQETFEMAKAQGKTKGQKRQIAIPKDSATFFRARARDPKMFKFTADGNLQVPEMRGEPAKVIELPFYRTSLIAELDEGESKRRDELVNVEKEYDETLQSLKEAMEIWRSTGSSADAMKFQRELTRLDTVRSQLRSPVRWTKEYKKLSIREVLTDQFYQVKKLPYSVYGLRLRSYPFEDLVRTTPLQREQEVQEVQEEQEEESFIFFSDPSDPEHGALSPETMVEFVFNSTKYNSLIQAYEVERITQLGRRKDFGPLLLKSRSATQIRFISSKIAGEVEKPRELWIEILKALIAQHPNYADVLRETGKDTLVYATPKEGRWGIGISAEDPDATDREKWKGPNILGQAWQAVRNSLPKVAVAVAEAEAEDTEVKIGGYTEHGKTEEEEKRQRANVLKGYYRKLRR